MVCDYYIETNLVIEFRDINGAISKTTTNIMINRRYISYISDEDSDDDLDTQSQQFEKELEKQIEKNTYKKIIYENNRWVKSSYEKKYLKDIKILCPTLVKIITIYKDNVAFSTP